MFRSRRMAFPEKEFSKQGCILLEYASSITVWKIKFFIWRYSCSTWSSFLLLYYKLKETNHLNFGNANEMNIIPDYLSFEYSNFDHLISNPFGFSCEFPCTLYSWFSIECTNRWLLYLLKMDHHLYDFYLGPELHKKGRILRMCPVPPIQSRWQRCRTSDRSRSDWSRISTKGQAWYTVTYAVPFLSQSGASRPYVLCRTYNIHIVWAHM